MSSLHMFPILVLAIGRKRKIRSIHASTLETGQYNQRWTTCESRRLPFITFQQLWMVNCDTCHIVTSATSHSQSKSTWANEFKTCILYVWWAINESSSLWTGRWVTAEVPQMSGRRGRRNLEWSLQWLKGEVCSWAQLSARSWMHGKQLLT